MRKLFEENFTIDEMSEMWYGWDNEGLLYGWENAKQEKFMQYLRKMGIIWTPLKLCMERS